MAKKKIKRSKVKKKASYRKPEVKKEVYKPRPKPRPKGIIKFFAIYRGTNVRLKDKRIVGLAGISDKYVIPGKEYEISQGMFNSLSVEEDYETFKRFVPEEIT